VTNTNKHSSSKYHNKIITQAIQKFKHRFARTPLPTTPGREHWVKPSCPEAVQGGEAQNAKRYGNINVGGLHIIIVYV